MKTATAESPVLAVTTVEEAHDVRALNHFIRLARNGKHRGASGGCLAAYPLALTILETVPRLDYLALDGMAVFVGLAKMAPESAREFLGR